MYRISRNFFGSLCAAPIVCVVSTLALSAIAPDYLVKSSAFAQDLREPSDNIENRVQLFHQGMTSHVNFTFEYGLKNNVLSNADSLERDRLTRDIASLLMAYPEAYDYWELVNLSITQDLLAMYPQLDYITLTLGMMPRELIPYYCVSTVTRWADDRVDEHWAFEINDIAVQNQPLDAYVSYTYRDDAHYPDFLEARTLMLDHLKVLQSRNLSRRELEENLTQHLFDHYSHNVSSVTIQLR